MPKAKHWVWCKNSRYLKFDHLMNGHDYLSHGAGLLDYLSRYHPHGSQALKVVNDSEGSAMVV